MLDPSVAFDLISQIYDAAIAPDLWRTFLEALAAAVGSGAANLALSLPREGSLGAVSASWDGAAATREYAEYFYAHDPWVQRTCAVPPGLGVAVDWGAIEPPEHTRRTEFWNDFLRRHGIGYEPPIGVMLRREGGRSTGACSIHPLQGQAGYGADEARLMGVLGPHLLRATGIHELLAEHQLARDTEIEVIDSIPFAVLLMNAQGRIVQANAFARRLLAEGDGLRPEGARLAGATPAITQALGRLIGDAIQTESKPASGRGGVIALPRPLPRRPLEALVAPVRAGATAWVDSRALAVLFVSDPDRRVEPPIETLRRLYGLTPGEAGVAAQLGSGSTVDEAADTLHITRNTARFYLKRVFSKTRTRRQAELVRLVSGGVAGLWGQDREDPEQPDEA